MSAPEQSPFKKTDLSKMVGEMRPPAPNAGLPTYFLPKKGFKFVLGGHLYKVVTMRPNGKGTIKVVKKLSAKELQPPKPKAPKKPIKLKVKENDDAGQTEKGTTEKAGS